VPAFVSNPNQRRLLPHADFVKIDVRDLDVEGPPVVHLARSYGALLVAEYVETPDTLRHARDLGFTLFQGNLLERAGVLDRASARRVSL
jgi:EAL and modified HD-GYP domain-containing signal transduction protein